LPTCLPMKRIICISGDAASGKTTAAKRVLARLAGDWRIVSTGARFRQFCAERGIDPQQISHLGDDLHREADAAMRQLLALEPHLIAEARLVGYLSRDMDDALRVFCYCPLEVRASRAAERDQGFDLEQSIARVRERDEADTANLIHLHAVDYHDPSYYHLWVNSALLDPDEIAALILQAAGATATQ
jgi:cytidylate kinase